MARPVKVRDDYVQDMIDVKRLRLAVLKDSKRPVEWRNETATALANVIKLLVIAPDKS